MSWLTATDRKEELSLAYLEAVAADVHLYVQVIGKDRDSVDAEVLARGYLVADSVRRSVKLEVQLKARTRVEERDGTLAVRIPVKNYDELRDPRNYVARILVVLVLPCADEEQVLWSPQELALRRCAYWYSLKGLPGVQASAESEHPTTTVHIPLANEFSPQTLHELMVRVSRLEELTDGP